MGEFQELPFVRARTFCLSLTNQMFTRTQLVTPTSFLVKPRSKIYLSKHKLMLPRNSMPLKLLYHPKWVLKEPPELLPEDNLPFLKMTKMKKSTRTEWKPTTLTW